MKINRTAMARRVAEREGGKLNLSIAQIREVQRLVLEELAAHECSEILALIETVRRENAP